MDITWEEIYELINSGNYQDRFKGEYAELRDRYLRLSKMLIDFEKGKLNFVPTCPIELLWRQSEYMFNYMNILEKRAKIEGIDLSRYI